MESILEKRFALSDLLDAATIVDVIHAATSCFDLGLTVMDREGKEVLVSCAEHPFCLAAKSDAGAARCNEVKGRLARQPLEEGQVLQIKSFCGLRYALFPLSYNLDLLGRCVVGPFRDPATDPATILAALGPPGQALTVKDVEKVPSIAPERLRLIIKLLARFFDAFLFVKAKRLLTGSLHLEAIYDAREAIFRQMERQDQGTAQDKEEIEKLKEMF